jgi:hypothetical protein
MMTTLRLPFVRASTCVISIDVKTFLIAFYIAFLSMPIIVYTRLNV